MNKQKQWWESSPIWQICQPLCTYQVPYLSCGDSESLLSRCVKMETDTCHYISDPQHRSGHSKNQKYKVRGEREKGILGIVVSNKIIEGWVFGLTVKIPLWMHIGLSVYGWVLVRLLIPLSCYCTRTAKKLSCRNDSLNTWVPATHVGEHHWIVGC